MTLVADSGRSITLDATPTRIFAEAMAGLSLWVYGIKPIRIAGWLRGHTFPEEWDDVARLDLETGELDIKKLIDLNPDFLVGFTWDSVNKYDFGAVDESSIPGFTDVPPSLCNLGVDVPISASIERSGELAAALGADKEAETIAASRAAFTAASDALHAAASAKPRLTAIALSGALKRSSKTLAAVAARLGEAVRLSPGQPWAVSPGRRANAANHSHERDRERLDRQPSVASDLVYFAELGFNLIGPETPNEYASGLFQ